MILNDHQSGYQSHGTLQTFKGVANINDSCAFYIVQLQIIYICITYSTVKYHWRVVPRRRWSSCYLLIWEQCNLMFEYAEDTKSEDLNL